MTTQLRVLITGTAFVAGLALLIGAGDRGAAAAPPVLPKGTYKKAAEGDIAELQRVIQICIDDEEGNAKRFTPTAKSMAMILAAYAEATGDKGLRDEALKAAGEIAKKDYVGALKTAKGLKVAPGDKPLAAAKGPKFELEEVMSPFRGGKVGGMNMEKDLRDFMNGRIPFDAAAVERLAVRTAVISEFAFSRPNDKADINDANRKKWQKYSTDSIDVSKKILDELGKGKSANTADIIKNLKLLEGKCTECHNDFRD